MKKNMLTGVAGMLCLAGIIISGCKKSSTFTNNTSTNGTETTARAVDPNPNADAAINGYNSAFLITSGSTQYYKTALNDNTKDYFWRQALDIQMVEDVYRRTKSTAHSTLITNLLNTFLVQNASTSGNQQDWTWNQYNDDLLWAGLAFARGYQVTHNSTFLNQAAYAFNLAYNRGWDASLGGGIWWDVAHTSKSGLSNNTAVMLGCYLYEFTRDITWLNKASAIYDWIWNSIYNHTTGAVYENMRPNGTVDMADNVYNAGAFIGAAGHLHRLTGRESLYDDAKRAVDYVRNNKTANGILSNGQRQGTWQSEFARGLGEFVRDNNLWSTYWGWMKQNADAAWNIRRTDWNIAWNQWTAPSPVDNVTTAVECVGAVVMQQVTPVTQPGFTDGATYRLTPRINSGSALDVHGGLTADGTGVEIYGWNGGANQKFQVAPLGRGYYRLIPANATTRSVDVPGASNTDNTLIDIWTSNTTTAQYWKLVYDYDGYYKLKPKCAPVSCMNVQGNNPANGSKCVIWPESYGDNERWLFQIQ
jgi:hypothetical protein